MQTALPLLTREEIVSMQSQGLKNKTYQSMRMHNIFVPRTFEFNAFTAFLMVTSAAGFIICKRYAIPSLPFGLTFGFTPIFALFHTKQMDSFYYSKNSRMTFEKSLQLFPEAAAAYKTIDAEADAIIADLQTKNQQLKQKLHL